MEVSAIPVNDANNLSQKQGTGKTKESGQVTDTDFMSLFVALMQMPMNNSLGGDTEASQGDQNEESAIPNGITGKDSLSLLLNQLPEWLSQNPTLLKQIQELMTGMLEQNQKLVSQNSGLQELLQTNDSSQQQVLNSNSENLLAAISAKEGNVASLQQLLLSQLQNVTGAKNNVTDDKGKELKIIANLDNTTDAAKTLAGVVSGKSKTDTGQAQHQQNLFFQNEVGVKAKESSNNVSEKFKSTINAKVSPIPTAETNKNITITPDLKLAQAASDPILVPKTADTVNGADIIRQVVEKIKVFKLSQGTEMHLDLQPEFLGKVSLKLVLQDGNLTAKLFTDNPQVKEVLQNAMPQLKEQFQNSGIKLQNVEVNSFENFYQQGQGRQEQQQRNKKYYLGATPEKVFSAASYPNLAAYFNQGLDAWA